MKHTHDSRLAIFFTVRCVFFLYISRIILNLAQFYGIQLNWLAGLTDCGWLFSWLAEIDVLQYRFSQMKGLPVYLYKFNGQHRVHREQKKRERVLRALLDINALQCSHFIHSNVFVDNEHFFFQQQKCELWIIRLHTHTKHTLVNLCIVVVLLDPRTYDHECRFVDRFNQ